MSIKVLQMNIDNKNGGGAFILIKQLEKYIKSNDITFDYLTMDEYIHDGLEESKVYSAHLRKNKVFGHILLPFFVYKILKHNRYSIIHINSDSSWKAWLYAYPAKKVGVKTVIVHSHSIGSDGTAKWLKNTLHRLFINKLDKVTDYRLACSEEAAKWMFPANKINSTNILFNGIEIENFKYNKIERKKIRHKLGIDDKFVLGQVGLVSSTKNQLFSISVLSEYLKKNNNAVLLIVGECDDIWKSKLISKAKRLGVKDNVIIYGSSTEIANMLSAMDVFLFPSIFEGAGIALVEAQANGLPCLISNSVPRITTVSSWITRLDLSDGPIIWASTIDPLVKFTKTLREKRIIDEKYGIKVSAEQLIQFYYESGQKSGGD